MSVRKISDIQRSPESEEQKARWVKAKRRMSYLTPDNAKKVLRHDRYWTVELLQLYTRRCEQLRLTDPDASWKMVRHLAELVALIRVGDGAGELGSRAEQASWLTRALALEGEIAGLNEDFERANAAFARAFGISVSERIQVVAAAELQRRRAAYAMGCGTLDEARHHLEQSLGLYRRLESGSGLAEALLLGGFLRWPGRGLVGLAEALACTRPRGMPEERVFDGAQALLMARMQEPRVTFEEYEAILGWLYLARKKWFARRSKTVRKMGLLWAEGRALSCLGLGRLAQRRLSRAWQGLSQLGAFEAVAVSGLDLATVQIGHDERSLAMDVLRESRQRVDRLCSDGELTDALHRAQGAIAHGAAGAEEWHRSEAIADGPILLPDEDGRANIVSVRAGRLTRPSEALEAGACRSGHSRASSARIRRAIPNPFSTVSNSPSNCASKQALRIGPKWGPGCSPNSIRCRPCTIGVGA